ncbi:MAG: TonB-dependent receptor [Pseudomonadota bacterium]
MPHGCRERGSLLANKGVLGLSAISAASLFSGAAFAESYIDEVVVTGQPQEAPPPAAVHGDVPIDLAWAVVERTSLSLSTNSRGETGFAIRGRSEREARVTLNGFSLIDPWDDRLNLATLPGASFRVHVRTLGDAAMGPGGVLALETIDDPQTRLTAEAGDFGHVRAHALLVRDRGVLAVEGLTREGARAPDDASLPFSQADVATRTNTDRDQASILAAGKDDWRDFTLTGLALFSSTQYGVAPEGHLDPEQSSVRFWRVPEDERLVLAAGASRTLVGRQAELKAWLHRNTQKISVFEDETYTESSGAEATTNLGVGVDAALRAEHWALGGSWNQASHEEQERGEPEEDFSRQNYAVWGQVTRPLTSDLSVSGDIRQEGFVTGDSGGREVEADLSLTTSRVRMIFAPAGGIGWSLETARLGRLPSQRELYGEALGRFLVNPNLEAERAWSGEGSLFAEWRGATLDVTTFVERRSDVIDQRIVLTDGGSLRQRINTDGYLAYGIETEGEAPLTDALTFRFSATIAEYDPRGATAFLTERPERQVAAALTYRAAGAFDGEIRLRHQSGASSLGEDGEQVALRAGTAIDVEAGLALRAGMRGYLRLDNAFDAEIVPQLGLPAPGRSLRVGVTWVM